MRPSVIPCLDVFYTVFSTEWPLYVSAIQTTVLGRKRDENTHMCVYTRTHTHTTSTPPIVREPLQRSEIFLWLSHSL